ncbi:MAG TPA: hypothetical protein VM846_18285 [Vicinamibacterales bacterium]|jgi:hypothetical protein|nr:hypothetical protein [Vicinamibacterales bacterium]
METLRRNAALLGAVVVLLLSAPAVARAQVWLPAKGQGAVSVLFSNTLSKEHFLPDRRFDFGHIDANTVLLDLTYGVTDRLTVNVGLPIVAARYRGSFPHRPVTLDDGAWHTNTQDFRFGVRYNVLDGPVVITPFAGSSLPSHDYEYFAHAAPGRALNEFVAGVGAGRLFAGLGLVVQGTYAYSVSESALDVPRRFSLASLETAYFITPGLRVMAITSSRIGHTGIDLLPNSGAVLPAEVFRHHDQISRESFLNVGGGIAVSLTDSIELFGGYTTTVTGRNTHATNRGVSLGVGWGFGQPGAPATAVAARRQSALVKCLCRKAG